MSEGLSAALGPRLAGLLAGAGTMDLGPGRLDPGVQAELASLADADLFGARPVVDRSMARAVLSGLWLKFDFLDESHRISQSLENPTGSYWHGIMHRREGDYGNAKYWFRRVGGHPIEESLCAQARGLAQAAKAGRSADFLATQSDWDHLRFVDLVQESIGAGSAAEALCRDVQDLEWRLLFDYAYGQAVGS